MKTRRFFRRLFRSHGSEPGKIVTDKLQSYGVAQLELIPETIHSTEQYENIRAEIVRRTNGDKWCLTATQAEP